MTSKVSKSLKSIFPPVLLGFILFGLMVGLNPLNPSNIGWLLNKLDPAQHFLGWDFFKNSSWTLPPGLNPRFGLDISSAIVYSDSIPLFAIPFKVFASFLPSPFQYFGIWVLVCFVLQAWVCWKLIELTLGKIAQENPLLHFFATGLLFLCPSFLWRINTPAGMHASLLAHFFILASLYLLLSNETKNRYRYWLLLLCGSLLTHFYLFVIVGLLWGADYLDRFHSQFAQRKLKCFFEITCALLLVGLLSWLVGYFSIRASLNSERGYGFFAMNVLGLIDPNGWSYILPNLSPKNDWGEGFSFLGLGIILLLLSCMPKLWSFRHWVLTFFQGHRFLIALMFFFILIAITHRIHFGTQLIVLPIPDRIINVLNNLRSAARLMWPVHYLIVLGALTLIGKAYPKKWSTIFFALFFFIQLGDTSKAWLVNQTQINEKFSQELASPKLQSQFWQDAAHFYHNIIVVPAMNLPPHWEQFATLAARYHLGTNSIHAARIDQHKERVSNQNLERILISGNFLKDSLYVLQNNVVISALGNLGENNLLAKVNGFNVLAPNWVSCNFCQALPPTEILTKSQFLELNDKPFTFSEKNSRAPYYLRSGWALPEAWGVWSNGKKAVLNLLIPSATSKSLTLHYKAFVNPITQPQLDFDVFINEKWFQKYRISQFEDNLLKIDLNKAMHSEKYLSIEFRVLNPVKPSAIGYNNADQRDLGIGLTAAVFE